MVFDRRAVPRARMRVNIKGSETVGELIAPKGPQNLAQGFNPGLVVRSACALKVALDEAVSWGRLGFRSRPRHLIWCPFPPSLANASYGGQAGHVA